MQKRWLRIGENKIRIISKFRDYYDGVQRQIFDEDTLYVREQREIGKDVLVSWHREEYNIRYGKIGFCGKEYAYCKFMFPDGSVDYFYDAESTHAHAHKYLTEEGYNNYCGRYHGSQSWINKYCRKAEIDKYFADIPVIENHDYFVKCNAPIYVIQRYPAYTVINPKLSNYQFQKVIHPYTAFQEIYMYVGGVLAGNNKPIPIVSDNDMIEAKGFDKKTSFRKPKED